MPLPSIARAETDSEIAACFPVMVQLRPHLRSDDFVTTVRRMMKEGFLLARRVDANGAVRAVAGYRIQEKLYSGRTLYVDDLITDQASRSQGHGAALLQWLVAEARTAGCDLFDLDSGVQRRDAHRFYFRERMHIAGYHFELPLKR